MRVHDTQAVHTQTRNRAHSRPIAKMRKETHTTREPCTHKREIVRPIAKIGKETRTTREPCTHKREIVRTLDRLRKQEDTHDTRAVHTQTRNCAHSRPIAKTGRQHASRAHSNAKLCALSTDCENRKTTRTTREPCTQRKRFLCVGGNVRKETVHIGTVSCARWGNFRKSVTFYVFYQMSEL